MQLIDLDPYSDCSAENPLYLKKEWIDYLYNELGLSDRSIAQVCGTINHKTINKWRNTHGIQARKEKASYIDESGYRVLLMPPDYKHPQLTYDASGRQVRREYIIVMEEYLSEHPEWDIIKQCLIDNKYLDVECEIHHINQDRLDNRIENLWLYKTKSEHALVQQDLNTCFSGLIKLEQVIFDNGRYYINDNFDYRTIPPERIKEIIKPAEIEDWEDINKAREEIKKN